MGCPNCASESQRTKTVWRPLQAQENLQVSIKEKLTLCGACATILRTTPLGVRKSWTTNKIPLAECLNTDEMAAIGRLILTGLLKNNRTAYTTLISASVKKGYSAHDFDAVLHQLYQSGWVWLQEHRSGPVRWEIQHVGRCPDTAARIKEHYGLNPPNTAPWLSIIQAGLEKCPVKGDAALRLRALLQSQVDLLVKGSAILYDPDGNVVADSRYSTHKYEELLRTLGEIAKVMQNRETIPLRVLATRVGEHSKALDGYRHDLEALLGDLASYGIIARVGEVRFWGDFVYTVDGHRADGKAGLPAVCLSTPSLDTFRVVECRASKVLLVENKVFFEELLRRGLRQCKDIVTVYSGGYLATPETRLIAHLVSAGVTEILFAADLDPHGIAIVCDANDRLSEATGISVKGILMDERLLLNSPRNIPLKNGDLELLDHITPPDELTALAEKIKATKVKVEQESLLDILTSDDITRL